MRPVLSTTVIIAVRRRVEQHRALEERHPAPVRRDAQRPRRTSFVDRGSSWKLDGPGTAVPGISDDGERIGSGNPIGVHDAGEHVAACTASHRDARQRAQAERPLDVLRAEQHGHVARSRNRHDPRVFQLEVARIAAPRTAEKCGVGLALPARAVDEALTIGGESSGRHDPPAECHRLILGDRGSGPHRRHRRRKHSGGQRSACDSAPESGAARPSARCQAPPLSCPSPPRRSTATRPPGRVPSASDPQGLSRGSEGSAAPVRPVPAAAATTAPAVPRRRWPPSERHGCRPRTVDVRSPSRRGRRRTRRCRRARPSRVLLSARAPCTEPSPR